MIRGLERRFLFTGDIVLQTPLHIGGGDTMISATDSPVVRTAEGQPFIPGSSLKGAFRSTVEKLAATIGLPHSEIDVIDASSEWAKKFRKDLDRRMEQPGWTDDDTIAFVEQEWPATALLFGTPHTAGKIFFADATLREQYDTTTQRRDGVAIDRDSERAMDKLLYNYEVVPSTLRLNFELQLENPKDTELGLTCLGLSEMLSGMFGIGGKRTSGMGRIQLDNLKIYALDLTTGNKGEKIQRLQRYLRGKTTEEKFTIVDNPQDFIDKKITLLLQEVAHAETSG